jgi:hypothetical protein
MMPEKSKIQKFYFAPGCALFLYKPELVDKVFSILHQQLDGLELLSTCCKNQPELEPGTQVISTCPGCIRRYIENYENLVVTPVWEVLAAANNSTMPDYKGRQMAILDACPVRNYGSVHDSIRNVLTQMNIKIVEPEKTKSKSICCGDSLWPKSPISAITKAMKKRASQMPDENVVVYCVSCVKSVYIGGKQPHYIVDLLFDEETIKGTLDTAEWHGQVDAFIANH